MRASYLIARREYLSYVATWGFWLSLLAVPVFATIGGALPGLIQNSQPTRYFAVIDETGRGLDQVVEQGLQSERRERVRAQLEDMVTLMRGEEAAAEALAVFDQDPDGLSQLNEAIEASGLGDAGSALGTERRERVMVEPPARDIDALRPYLAGERMISTPEGERGLFAAIILRDSEDAPVRLEYHSTNVTSDSVKIAVRNVLRSHFREEAFMERGLSPDDLDAVMAIDPDVVEIDARPGAETGAEVTRADRAPFFVAIAFAFLLWIAVFSVANMLLTSLVEEKGGKIIELLLSTARFHEILIGKLAGVAAVSLTLMGVWGAVGGGLAILGGAVLATMNPGLAAFIAGLFDPGLIVAALFFFAAGYMMYGAIFLAMGSLCDTLQDAQTLMGPVIWTLLLPMFFLVFSIEATDSVLLRFASWFPLWTPFLMMARLPSDPPLWELAGASALMIVTMIIVVWGAAAVFRQGALRQADADSVRRFFRLKKKEA